MQKDFKPTMSSDERKARAAFLEAYIRKAAISLSPGGEINKLALKSGISYNTVMTSIRRGFFSAGGACALEVAVGREHLKKEELAPHIYAKEV